MHPTKTSQRTCQQVFSGPVGTGTGAGAHGAQELFLLDHIGGLESFAWRAQGVMRDNKVVSKALALFIGVMPTIAFYI